MHRKQKYQPWMRYPRTQQERRANGKRCEWARGRRSASNLPTAYDDKYVHTEKNWKGKRLTQYRPNGRGREHSLYISADREWGSLQHWVWYSTVRNLECYFEDFDIPHVIEKDRVGYTKTYVVTTQPVKVGTTDVYRDRNGIRSVWYSFDRYEDVPLEKPYSYTRHWSELKGYKITYWTNKNIDIQRILSLQ